MWGEKGGGKLFRSSRVIFVSGISCHLFFIALKARKILLNRIRAVKNLVSKLPPDVSIGEIVKSHARASIRSLAPSMTPIWVVVAIVVVLMVEVLAGAKIVVVVVVVLLV